MFGSGLGALGEVGSTSGGFRRGAQGPSTGLISCHEAERACGLLVRPVGGGSEVPGTFGCLFGSVIRVRQRPMGCSTARRRDE